MLVSRLFLTLFSITLILLPHPSHSASSVPQGDCLWISPRSALRQGDGSLLLDLVIRFGRFPAGGDDLTSLRDLRASYAISAEKGGNAWRTGKIGIDLSRDRGAFRIRLDPGERIVLRAGATGREGNTVVHHQAMFAYLRPGRSKGSNSPEPPEQILGEKRLLRLSPCFHYWRQVGEPLTLEYMDHKNPEAEAILTIQDEHLPPQRIQLHPLRATSWTPPDDDILNGRDMRSGKETLLVVESHGGDACFRGTEVLQLHRNRTSHRRQFPGLLLLVGSSTLCTATLLLKRRKAP